MNRIECPGDGTCLVQGDYGYVVLPEQACPHGCQPVTCPNASFCEHDRESQWLLDCHGGFCMSCGIHGFGVLEFRDAGEEECTICGEAGKTLMKFPARQCVHFFCVLCCRNLINWDETRYHLNPCDYGCPPCPNGCLNPQRGRQCDCYEYDIVKETWETECPQDFATYNDDEDRSIARGEESGSSFASRKCPLCRESC